MARNTWWVEFGWTYNVKDTETDKWEEEYDFEAQRFNCTKKQIPEEVRKYVEDEMKYVGEYKDLQIKITDKYITTDSEL
jgi:hypothetical protein